MYDQGSGQVFSEWTIRRPSTSSSALNDWSRQRRYPKIKVRGRKGPRSLAQMAVTTIADNIGYMTPEHLETLPKDLLLRIWAVLEARGVNLQGWKIFSQLLLAENDNETTLGFYRFRQHICNPTESLQAYTRPLISLNHSFITHLVISGGCNMAPADLLCLAEIPNLGVLEFIRPADELPLPFPEISDRLIRGWSEKDDPFPLLRILRIWGDGATTQASLRWAAQFPSLALYDVKAFREDWQSVQDLATSAGWTLEDCKEESPFHYLSMLAQVETLADVNTRRKQAQRIDADLTSLSSDPRSSVRFIPAGTAPSLVDYLSDTAKRYSLPSWDADAASRVARECQGIAFEAWAFWLYSLLGQLSMDQDLKDRGIKIPEQAVAGPFTLPSKPMACLYLGHSGRGGIAANPAYIRRGLFATKKYTFTRPEVVRGNKPKSAPKVPNKRGQEDEAMGHVSSAPLKVARLRKGKVAQLDQLLKGLSKGDKRVGRDPVDATSK